MWKLQMEKKDTVRSLLIGKDHFNVTINPNIDHAFIVALVVILDAIWSNLGDVVSGLTQGIF
jgi:uncharacterized protein YxjI